MKNKYHTIIIGGGVAGMTAALYLKRAGIDTVIFEREAPGGQITKTATIENYPGIEKIEGPELAIHMYNQVMSLEVPFIFQEITEIIPGENQVIVKTRDEEYECQYLILALGRNPKKLGIKNEEKLSGRGISWCAVCDGPLYKNKKVAVIGGGRAAVEEAIYLSKLCSQVTLIHRREEFRAENSLVEELNKIENIKVLVPESVLEFKEEQGKLKSLILENHEELEVDGCFEFIGGAPTTSLCVGLDILDEEGYIKVNEKYETPLKNIYAGGDCIKKNLYQIVTACADGASIAEEIKKKDSKKY